MGKGRSTAKTGSGRGARREEASGSSSKRAEAAEDDQDYMRLEKDVERRSQEDEEDSGLPSQYQEVMDLGAGADSDDEDSSDEEDGQDEKDHANPQDDLRSDEDEDDEDSESGEEDDDLEVSDPRNWGRKKSAYYNGDTADLEIGQDEDDAFVEEEAVREVQSSRFEEMDEDDFVLSDGEDEPSNNRQESTSDAQEKLISNRDTTKLSSKEQRKLLNKQHPELMPVVSHFSSIVKELEDTTRVATKALIHENGAAESVGATPQGQQFLLTKSLIQNSVALNTVMYLLLKSEIDGKDSRETLLKGDVGATSSLQSHPVMVQLKRCNSTMQKFEERVEKQVDGTAVQMENLVKAAAVMLDSNTEEQETDVLQSSSDDEASAESIEEPSNAAEEELEKLESKSLPRRSVNIEKTEGPSDGVLDEARFGLRPHEVKRKEKKRGQKRHSNLADFGDLEGGEVPAPKAFSATMNSIEQRTKQSRKKPAAVAEDLDEMEEDDHELAQGLKMMEELGEPGSRDAGGADETMGHSERESPLEGDAMSFYNEVAKRSKDKKSIKKARYEVAPKFPGSEGEVTGERAISRTIMKNRGLVAHKAKINSNPRVKKREQYRKALIRRKGAVREVREDEGHKYGGEGTGIKSGISRSRKLVS